MPLLRCSERVCSAAKLSASVVIAAVILWTESSPEAQAFKSFKLCGGTIHRDILEKGLAPLGLSQKSIAIIGKGTDSQDIPFSAKFTKSPQNHCDDELIKEGCHYWQSRVKQAAADAEAADRDHRRCRSALFKFGEAMHTVQDFYSHSNYLEWLLQNGMELEPIDWDNIPAGITTGYYYYDSILIEEPFVSRERAIWGLSKKHDKLQFHSDDEFEKRKKDNSSGGAVEFALAPVQFLHMELNKDDKKSLEGKISSTRYKMTFHQLARELAEKDTARQWKSLESMIKSQYGERSPAILAALRAG